MTSIELLHNDSTKLLEAADLNLYRIHTLERGQAKKLVQASREPAMLRWVPGDNERRFPTVEAAQEWFSRDNKMVFAVGRGATLNALAWFSQKPSTNPEVDAEYTYGIRMYHQIRGQGLGQTVMAATHAAFYEADHATDAVWLATDSDNASALKLYTKFGYKKVDESDGRVFMVLPAPATDA